VGLLPLLPLAVVAIALGGPIWASKLSSMNIEADGVVVRNFPHRTRRVPLFKIDRFDQLGREGAWSPVRFVRAYLLLTDGSRMIIRRCSDPEVGTGVTALNNRLEDMRRAMHPS
jgi:hypothetical protein